MNIVLRTFVIIGGLSLVSGCNPDAAALDVNDRDAPYSCAEMLMLDLEGVDVATLDTTVLPERRRIIPPGSAVTMDYIPDRLNLEVDETGIITRVYCG